METGTRQATTEAGPEDLPSPPAEHGVASFNPRVRIPASDIWPPASAFRHASLLKPIPVGGVPPQLLHSASFIGSEKLQNEPISDFTYLVVHQCITNIQTRANPKKAQIPSFTHSKFGVQRSMFDVPPGPQCKFPVPSRQSASKYVKGGFPQQRKPFSRWHFPVHVLMRKATIIL